MLEPVIWGKVDGKSTEAIINLAKCSFRGPQRPLVLVVEAPLVALVVVLEAQAPRQGQGEEEGDRGGAQDQVNMYNLIS